VFLHCRPARESHKQAVRAFLLAQEAASHHYHRLAPSSVHTCCSPPCSMTACWPAGLRTHSSISAQTAAAVPALTGPPSSSLTSASTPPSLIIASCAPNSPRSSPLLSHFAPHPSPFHFICMHTNSSLYRGLSPCQTPLLFHLPCISEPSTETGMIVSDTRLQCLESAALGMNLADGRNPFLKPSASMARGFERAHLGLWVAACECLECPGSMGREWVIGTCLQQSNKGRRTALSDHLP
jgi:hypothetical protein